MQETVNRLPNSKSYYWLKPHLQVLSSTNTANSTKI